VLGFTPHTWPKWGCDTGIDVKLKEKKERKVPSVVLQKKVFISKNESHLLTGTGSSWPPHQVPTNIGPKPVETSPENLLSRGLTSRAPPNGQSSQ